MSNLRLTHRDWSALDQWERDKWVAYEMYRQRELGEFVKKLSNSEIDPNVLVQVLANVKRSLV